MDQIKDFDDGIVALHNLANKADMLAKLSEQNYEQSDLTELRKSIEGQTAFLEDLARDLHEVVTFFRTLD